MTVNPISASATAPVAPPPAPSAGFARTLQAALEAPAATHGHASAVPGEGVRVTLGQMLDFHAGTTPAGGLAAMLGRPVPVHQQAAVRAPAGAPPAAGDLGIGPVARPLPGEVGSEYGPRVHPVHGDLRQHHGVDIGAPTGTPIHAYAAGTVSFAGTQGGYGKIVIIDHGNGITTRYAHQSAMDVAVGDRVGAGDVIGRVGATGTATGPHLHFEIRRDGESIDPAPYLR